MIAQIIGGLGLFLMGIWLMTDGLKLAAGDTLKGDPWPLDLDAAPGARYRAGPAGRRLRRGSLRRRRWCW